MQKDAMIKDKCIWVTGASSGIGRQLAIDLCNAGNFVIVSARRESQLNQLAAGFHGRMRVLAMDVAESGEALDEAKIKLAGITDYLDMVICCAGICEYEDKLDFNPGRYERVLRVNFLGVVNALHLAMPLLKKSQHTPHFSAVGSLSSTAAFPRAEAYGASKAALEYFMKSLKADLVRCPMDVSLIRPGFVATELTQDNDFDMPFTITVEQASRRIIEGLSRKKKIIDFPRRLSWPLRIFGSMFGFWLQWVAPKITRQCKKSWQQS